MAQVNGKEVGRIGFGLMGMTWRNPAPPVEQSFKAMKASLAMGANFWNAGEFYGPPEFNSLHLLNQYFTKYPEDADKVLISVKGGLKLENLHPDGSREGVRRSIDQSLKVLDGKKFLDIFECARVDPDVPIEETIGYIAEYVKAGKVGGISLSECNANTIRRAAKVHPIACVEVEFSLYATEILENGIAEACGELNIPIVAYSPLGRGFLVGADSGHKDAIRSQVEQTGAIKKFEDLPEGDFRRHMPRFQPDVFGENLKLTQEVEHIAQQKGVTPAQVSLAWVLAHSRKNGLAEIIPIPGATTEARVLENNKQVTLSEQEVIILGEILKRIEIKGGRYPPAHDHLLNG